MGGGIDTGAIAASYSRRFAAAVAKLLAEEGSTFVDDPADRGGATKFGISLRFLIANGAVDFNHDGLADFDLDMNGDIDADDVRELTMSEAVSLYWRCFWQALLCETFIVPIGEMLFDQAVNGGAAAAKKLLQTAINHCAAHMTGIGRLTVDGILGIRSRLAMAAVLDHPALGVSALAQAYRDAAAARYRAIVAEDPDQAKYLNGWLARAAALGVET